MCVCVCVCVCVYGGDLRRVKQVGLEIAIWAFYLN